MPTQQNLNLNHREDHCLMLNWQGIPYKSQTTYYNLITDLLNQISETTDITSNSIVITLTNCIAGTLCMIGIYSINIPSVSNQSEAFIQVQSHLT